MRQITVYPGLADLAEGAGNLFFKSATAALAGKGSFCVALSGGATPQPLYRYLREQYHHSLEWRRMLRATHYFWVDERDVPPADSRSNFGNANRIFFSHCAIPAHALHPVRTDGHDAVRAAESYARTLTDFFGLKPGEWPVFDLMLLGLGADGHTASLFAHSPALGQTEKPVVACMLEPSQPQRITVTMPVINHAQTVAFLVAGADKAEILAQVLAEAHPPEVLPARLVRPRGSSPHWLIEQAAAGRIGEFL